MAWVWPTVCKTISQPYGRKNARYVKGYHTGVDIACANGSPIRAVADGKITAEGWNGPYGNQVKQSVGGGEVWYNHLSRIEVKKRSEEHTSELQSLIRTSYAVVGLKK